MCLAVVGKRKADEGIVGCEPHNISEDSKGNIWVTTENKGVKSKQSAAVGRSPDTTA